MKEIKIVDKHLYREDRFSGVVYDVLDALLTLVFTVCVANLMIERGISSDIVYFIVFIIALVTIPRVTDRKKEEGNHSWDY